MTDENSLGSNIMIVQGNHKKRNAAIVVVISLIVLATFAYLFQAGFIDFGNLSKLAILPTPSAPVVTRVDLESCNLKAEGNPLVYGEIIRIKEGQRDDLVGAFRGNVNQVELTEQGALLEMLSPRADQKYTFSIISEKNLIMNNATQKEMQLSELKPGMTLLMSFNCYKNQNNKFKIVSIIVMGI